MRIEPLLKLLHRHFLRPLCVTAGILAAVWCWGAAYYTFPWPEGWEFSASLLFFLLLLALAAGGWFRGTLLAVMAALELATIFFFALRTPERAFEGVRWQRPWARAPHVELDGERAKIGNIRNFRYRTEEDFDSVYISGTYDLEQVQSVDLAISHWDGLEAVAHTMLSFGFRDGRHLAISMETRLPEGEEQGFLPGFYKQYEILMVIALEEDLFRLRTDFRGEELYLYRTNATPEQARTMLDSLLNRAVKLEREPEFYNSITENCTTSLAPLLREINPSFEGDIRLLLNGRSDELLYELGYLRHRERVSFAELKRRSRVAPQGVAPAEYSHAIRAGAKAAAAGTR